METTIPAAPSLAGLADYMRSYYTEGIGAAPWRCGDWLVSTNGWAAVAVPSPRMGQADTLPEKLLKVNDWLINGELEYPVSCRFEDLAKRAGAVPVVEDAPCGDCGGSGRDDGEETTCEHCHHSTRMECDHCGGEGVITPMLPQQPVRICGLVLDMTVLAYPLALVTPCESVQIGPIKGHEGKMLGIFADGWRIAVVAMASWAAKDAPTWEVPR